MRATAVNVSCRCRQPTPETVQCVLALHEGDVLRRPARIDESASDAQVDEGGVMVAMGKRERDALETLNRHGVQYLVIGGHALRYHGVDHNPGDVDIVVSRSSVNAQRFYRAIVEITALPLTFSGGGFHFDPGSLRFVSAVGAELPLPHDPFEIVLTREREELHSTRLDVVC